MKCFVLAILPLFFSCKDFGGESNPENDLPNATDIPIVINTNVPEDALMGAFSGKDSVYVFINEIDTTNNTTRIGFQNQQLPEITIPESIGAELQLLKLKNFKNDVLLVNAKLPDTNFNEYYVFVYKDTAWTQPVNRFDIHKSNMSDTLIPIRNNPRDSTQLLRYYSAFEMDRKSEKKFTWKLMQESVMIEE